MANLLNKKELAQSHKPQHQDIYSPSDVDGIENIAPNGNSVNENNEDPELLQKEQPTAPSGRGPGRPPKRGIKKIIVATGRGRGRPKKVSQPESSGEEADNNEVTETIKSPSPEENEQRPDPEPRGRGRPPKGGKSKIIVATGRGRGRPKKVSQPESSGDEANNNELTETIKSPLPKQRGRPKKPRNSDQESDDDDDRRKTNTVSDSHGRSNRRDKEIVNAIPQAHGKRGRPPKVQPSTKVTDKPRGRPKAGTTEVLSKDDNEEDESELSADDVDKD